jgi:hypothetical protein
MYYMDLLDFLRDEMERAIQSRDPLPANLTQLYEALESTWAKIPVDAFDSCRVHGPTN